MKALKDRLAEKTDDQLMYYLEYVDKHTDEAIRLAMAELQHRKVELPEGMVERVELQLSDRNITEAKSKKSWDNFMVQDDVSPQFYSQRAIYCFSILFSVFFGSFLLSANLKAVDKPRLLVILYGFAYAVLTIIVGEYMKTGLSYAFIANSIGVIIMQTLFWDRLIGKETKYNAKPIWKPLIIGVLIIAVLIMLFLFANQ
ncbi:hypothetical protein [Pedobacter sp. Hv1]|uniref:hypothetical protein n=1 Tax=Pedobacter sp. Hv1 TaxID=1740090 RepID=UPI0006D89D53|nr:hypothetical protein [Pedobacter sp. Hv1]KQC02456.1 hypothetical protein AQF98_02435 [Pedobacter sp. Hv1]